METSILTPTQKYAAAALFALALHQSQIHQGRAWNPLWPIENEPIGEGVTFSKLSVADKPHLWIHENSGLLLPILRSLRVDEQAWDGLKETAGSSSQVRHHVGAFLKLLSEEGDGESKDRMTQEIALTNVVEATANTMENPPISSEENGKESGETTQNSTSNEEKAPSETGDVASERCMEEAKSLSYQRKVVALYELLSACLAGNAEYNNKSVQLRNGYDARHRVALRLVATWLSIDWKEVEAMEIMVAYNIMTLVKEEGMDEDANKVSESKWDKLKRGSIIAAAAVTGGTVMALTGGLAAPAIAGGLNAIAPALGTIFPAIGAGAFSAVAGATGSMAGSAAVAASFGAAGASLSGSKMATRIGCVDEFEFKNVGENHGQGRLAVGILVSGIVFEEEDFVRPWEGYTDNLERYAIQWETKNLIPLTTAIRDWLTSSITLELMKDGAMLTVLSGLITALAIPAALLTATDLIDNKWAVAVDRSDQTGKLLAQVLLNGFHGNRPVTLIGFSLGARVIFKCLQALAEAKGDSAGLVERVVLLGAPIPIKDEKWEDVRKMVAGRFINAYATNDWTLGIAYRASLLSQGLAGIQAVDVPGFENVDVTEYIDGHHSYLDKAKQILEQFELENYYPDFKTTPMKTTQEERQPKTA